MKSEDEDIIEEEYEDNPKAALGTQKDNADDESYFSDNYKSEDSKAEISADQDYSMDDYVEEDNEPQQSQKPKLMSFAGRIDM